MRFETNPQLILTKDEFDTLNKALKLCQDINKQISREPVCKNCPFNGNFACMCLDCVYKQAQESLEQIIDIAIIK